MRIPQHPPDFRRLLAASAFERFDHILQTVHRCPDNRYLHWDELVNRPPIEDLSREEYWLALKLSRGQSKTTPLTDTTGKPFVFNLPDKASELLHNIEQNAGGYLGTSEQTVINTDQRHRYIVRSLIEEAISSSQLEGAATTRIVAKNMIRSGRLPRDKSEQMILNNYRTMEQIRELRKQDLTPDMVFELHRLVAKDTLDNPDAVGRFRHTEEHVRVVGMYNEVFHVPPPATDLPQRMAAMCDFANGKTPNYFIHPIIRSTILHFWLAYDHPFFDGNGRCARALFYWSMLRQNYWLCEFISISEIIRKAPTQYGRAFLFTETDDNDLTYFILYHLEIVKKALLQVHKYIAEKTSEIKETESLLHATVGLNYRQLSLLTHALRHPDASYTIASHQTSHRVTYQTARIDLQHLAYRRKLLIERKIGRAFHYRPVPDLSTRLRNLS